MAYKRIEQYDEDVTKGLMKNYREAIRLIGEDPEREGLLKTPERHCKSNAILYPGLRSRCQCDFKFAKFHEDISEMIIVKNIELYSMCEHHMLPFFGKAHIAYIPNGWITGLKQNCKGSRCFCKKVAGAGKTDHANFKCHPGNA